MPLPNHLDLDARVRWEAEGLAPTVEVTRAQLKELRTLGHKVLRYLASRQGFWKSDALDEAKEQGWLRDASAPMPIEGDGLFACPVHLDEAALHLPQVVLPEDLTQRLAALWQRCDPEAPKTLPSALVVPAGANAPLWLALLRLRPLRDLWERELRRATFESLLSMLPRAWTLDPAPLPPGAVVPGLEISGWALLPRLRSSGHRFAVAPAEHMEAPIVLEGSIPEADWSSALENALGSFAAHPQVLIELDHRQETSLPLLVAFYEKKGGRVEAAGMLALTPEETGHYLPGLISQA